MLVYISRCYGDLWYKKHVGFCVFVKTSKLSDYYQISNGPQQGSILLKSDCVPCDNHGKLLSENDLHYNNNSIMVRFWAITYRNKDKLKVEIVEAESMLKALIQSRQNAESVISCASF